MGPELLFVCFQIYWITELRTDVTLEKALLLIQVLTKRKASSPRA